MDERIMEKDTLLDEGGPSSLYLHFPFCASRCSYCDFTTDAYPADDPLMREYAFALSFLVRSCSVADLVGGIRTIYFGGGTPSFIGNRNLTSLVYLISTRINLTDETEFTLELNPDSFDEKTFKDLWALGVNRYSVGVQSFDDEVLHTLGRRHDAAQAERVLSLLATRDANRSIDLMCGIPGQSPESFLSDVSHSIELGIPHLSIYPLTVEAGTPFAHMLEAGTIEPVDEDLQAEEMLAARDLLEAAGLVRYEVSNYARPGFESRHNLAYWTGKEYLGVGTSASGFVSAKTFSRLRERGLVTCADVELPDDAFVRITDTATASEQAASSSMPVSCEPLTRQQAICEQVMLRMRLAEGISRELLDEATGEVVGLERVFDDLIAEGLLSRMDDRMIPTDRGWLCGNEVFAAIWDLVAQ